MAERGEAPEERLLVEAAQKDPARFAELYERHFERVYAYIARRVSDRDAAQDLTADVFHQALAHLGRYEWRGAPFGAWLLRIAANAVADRARKGQRERGDVIEDISDQASLPADAKLEEVEEYARLFRLVRALPPEQCRVIVARFVERQSIAEIAQALGRSEGAVKQLQLRALKNLRARLEDPHG